MADHPLHYFEALPHGDDDPPRFKSHVFTLNPDGTKAHRFSSGPFTKESIAIASGKEWCAENGFPCEAAPKA